MFKGIFIRQSNTSTSTNISAAAQQTGAPLHREPQEVIVDEKSNAEKHVDTTSHSIAEEKQRKPIETVHSVVKDPQDVVQS